MLRPLLPGVIAHRQFGAVRFRADELSCATTILPQLTLMAFFQHSHKATARRLTLSFTAQVRELVSPIASINLTINKTPFP